MSPNETAQTSPIVSDDRIREKLRQHLNIAINVRKTMTRQELASSSGVNIHTIDAILSRDPGKQRRVCFAEGLSIAAVLGDVAVNAMFGLIGWVGRPQDEPDQVNPMTVAANGMTQLAIIATAAADGRIDHVERGPVTAAADMLIATMLPLSSAGSN